MAKAKKVQQKIPLVKKSANKKISKTKTASKKAIKGLKQDKGFNYKFSWKHVLIKDQKSIPISRSSHGVSAIKDTVYVFGGENIPRTAIDSTLHSLNTCKNVNRYEQAQWKKVITINKKWVPPPRVAHAQAVIGDEIYIFGGRQGLGMGDKDMNDLWSFNVNYKCWKEIKNQKGPIPCPRSFHKMAAVGGYLYVFGGCGSTGRMNDLHKYDPKYNKWTKLPQSDKIKGRGGAVFQASPDGKSLYVVAGFTGEENSDVHRFDISSSKWIQLESFPQKKIAKRSVSAAATIKSMDLVVVFGGELEPSARGHEGAGNFGNEVIYLETNKKGAVFEKAKVDGTKSPTPRGWLTSDVLQEGKNKNGDRFAEIVFYGGLSGNDKKMQRNNDTWVLKIEQKSK